MASLSAYYPQPVVAGTTAGTYAEGDRVAQLGAGSTVRVLPDNASTVERSLRDRFSEKVNVKDFGAEGNGTTNDQPAIQAAINAASAGSIIYFPKGTYFLGEGESTGLTIGKNLAFVGESDSSSIITLDKSIDSGFRLQQGCSLAVFEKLGIEYRQGFYNSGTTEEGGSAQIGIFVTGINLDAEISINECTISNIPNAFYAVSRFKYLFVNQTNLLYTHGIASCRWYGLGDEEGHPTQVILGAGETTVIKNCYFNGLIDPTFTNTLGNPIDRWKTPVDGIFFTAGFSPIYQEISNCTVLNHGIEGVFLHGIGATQAYYLNSSNNKTPSSLVISDSNTGDFFWPKLATVTLNNHGYIVGDTVTISGASSGNGEHMVQSVADANTFTVLLGSGTNGAATGNIVCNVTRSERRRVSIARNNYITQSPHKSAYYAGTQPSIVVTDTTGEVIEISNNTIVGGVSSTISATSRKIWPQGLIRFCPRIKENYIDNSLIGISFNRTQSGSLIENNYIRTSSEFAKRQNVWPQYLNTYCFPAAVSVDSSDVTIRNNTIYQEAPLWDGVLTVTQRNNESNSFTVTDGSIISDNLAPLDFQNNQDYGSFVTIANNKINIFLITGVSGNTVTIDPSWFANNTDFSTGTAYWAKTSRDVFNRIGAIHILTNTGKTVDIENNKITNALRDFYIVEPSGNNYATNNNLIDLETYFTSSAISRYGEEYRDRVKINYTNTTGTSAPSSTPNFVGQIFVNTSANIIYMATGTSSSSDWKALATWNP